MAGLVTLTGFWITMETPLWVWLGGGSQRGSTERGGALFRGLGSWTEWKGESELGTGTDLPLTPGCRCSVASCLVLCHHIPATTGRISLKCKPTPNPSPLRCFWSGTLVSDEKKN